MGIPKEGLGKPKMHFNGREDASVETDLWSVFLYIADAPKVRLYTPSGIVGGLSYTRHDYPCALIVFWFAIYGLSTSGTVTLPSSF